MWQWVTEVSFIDKPLSKCAIVRKCKSAFWTKNDLLSRYMNICFYMKWKVFFEMQNNK